MCGLCECAHVVERVERRTAQFVAAQVLHACGERQGRRVDSGRDRVLQAPSTTMFGCRSSSGGGGCNDNWRWQLSDRIHISSVFR